MSSYVSTTDRTRQFYTIFSPLFSSYFFISVLLNFNLYLCVFVWVWIIDIFCSSVNWKHVHNVILYFEQNKTGLLKCILYKNVYLRAILLKCVKPLLLKFLNIKSTLLEAFEFTMQRSTCIIVILEQLT